MDEHRFHDPDNIWEFIHKARPEGWRAMNAMWVMARIMGIPTEPSAEEQREIEAVRERCVKLKRRLA